MIPGADAIAGSDEQVRVLSAELAPDAARLVMEVLDPRTGRLRLLPASFWKALDPELVMRFATVTARWCIVTAELVEWLRERIAGRKAIEIGAGNGDLGFHLGIPQTDSRAHQHDPLVQKRALELGHPLTSPPPDVIKLDALAAVHAMRPEVVVAAWVTQHGSSRDGADQSYYLAVRETTIVREVDYILIGNQSAHGRKRILALPHTEHAPEWLVSRAFHPERDRIWVWKRWREKRAR